MASRVRLGVAMFSATTGVGLRDREVKDDSVMARGDGGDVVVAGTIDVQTTTECVTRRMRARSCSGMDILPLGDNDAEVLA